MFRLQAAETDNIILEHQRAARQKTLKEMGKEKKQTRSPKKSTKKLNPRLVEVLSCASCWVIQLLQPLHFWWSPNLQSRSILISTWWWPLQRYKQEKLNPIFVPLMGQVCSTHECDRFHRRVDCIYMPSFVYFLHTWLKFKAEIGYHHLRLLTLFIITKTFAPSAPLLLFTERHFLHSWWPSDRKILQNLSGDLLL